MCCVLSSFDWSDVFFLSFLHFQQYNYQNDDSPPHDQGFLRLTSEVTPELVHVSEKNLSEIENVHGYVSHSHISPLKVSMPELHSYSLPWNQLQGKASFSFTFTFTFFPLVICPFSCHLMSECILFCLIFFLYFFFISIYPFSILHYFVIYLSRVKS